MKPVIDIHSHILPAVDDGCPNFLVAMQMISAYENQGVKAVICTPHFGPCGITGADVEGTFMALQRINTPIKFYLGNEILFTHHTVKDLRNCSARTLAGSRYVLIEFEEWEEYHASPEEIKNAMLLLTKTEFTPILAHPERYTAIQSKPELCKLLVDNGVQLQINAYDITENQKSVVRKLTQQLITDGLVSDIGSDAHGMRRKPALQTGVQWIYDHCPEEYADAIVHDNAADIIKEGEA